MIGVIKRNEDIEEFEKEKIWLAVYQASADTEKGESETLADEISSKVEKLATEQNKKTGKYLHVEEIQDKIEMFLMESERKDIAKAYILYRKQHQNVRELTKETLNFSATVNKYLDRSDWRVKENSSVTYSIGGLKQHNNGTIIANYWLNELYDDEIGRSHKNGDMHIHDLTELAGYCTGWSLKQLVEEGLGGVEGKITSAPAKHLSTLVNQMVNFLGVLQNEWAGAQAFSSFDTYLAPFVKSDQLNYKSTKQAIQSFVFGANTPARWGSQSPFSNITLDWVVPNDLRDLPAIIGGKPQDFTYGDCQKEMDMINRAFIEVMLEGDYAGRGFLYPIPTYNITEDFDWENENVPLLFEMTAKYGTPYFQNFINSDMDPSDVRSMCCRLQLDKRELRRRGGALFGSDEFTGSIGVVTINLPRLAYNSQTKEDFFENLDKMMNVAKRTLETKRKIVTTLKEEGLYPYTERYLKNYDNHFSTIGLVGMNEACLNANWIKDTIGSESGHAFAENVLDFMREKLADFQEETDNLYNLEATPAESASYRLAKHDKELYPDIITAGENEPFYTNSTHLPVNFSDNMFDALDLQETLQTKYTGGTVFHGFLGERIQDWETARNLVKKIAENYRIPYFTLSPTYSVCSEHGYITGEVYTCPKCGKPTETYSRITGYYRPVQHWNNGKQEEFKQRETYDPKEGNQNEIRGNREVEFNGLSKENINNPVYAGVQFQV
jgi:ribonucleoside-triphosphate reductase